MKALARLGGYDLRPFGYFAVLLLVASGASCLVGGLMSVLVAATVVILALAVGVVAHTTRHDARLNAVLADRWNQTLRQRQNDTTRRSAETRDTRGGAA